MNTRIKHKARGVHPRVRELADRIGLPLFRRDRELWLNGDLQLTYRKRIVGGVAVDADDADRVLMAVSILEGILEARRSWGTIDDRFRRVLAGLGETVPSYRRNTYTYYREPTLDHGWMFQCHIEPRWEMGICLCGFEEIRASGATTEDCLKQLARKYEAKAKK